MTPFVFGLAVLALAPAPSAEPAETPWIEEYKPVRGMWELGAFGGAFIIAQPHDFYDPQLGFRQLNKAAPDVGLRAAYYPLSFLGIEGEFAAIWTTAKYAKQPAFLYGLRFSGILQLPLYRLVPFFVGGYGLMGVRSNRDSLGNDIDPVGHYGGGLKLFVTRWIALRLEGRHLIGAAAQQRQKIANHAEVLFGVSVTLGRPKERAAE
jgi:OmpA-OmpF porin, OOP family